jgi:hypothetical protein
MHSPNAQGSVHNSWKLKMSQFFHSQQSPDVKHVWDALDQYDSAFPFPPISSNVAVIEEWYNIPQSAPCKGDALCCVRQKVVTPDLTDFLIHAPALQG